MLDNHRLDGVRMRAGDVTAEILQELSKEIDEMREKVEKVSGNKPAQTGASTTKPESKK